MRPREDRPEPLGYIEAARASVHRNNRTSAIVARARYQLEHGPHGRPEGLDGPSFATESVLQRLVDMADEDDAEAAGVNADEREQLASGLLAVLGDSFCELLTGPDGTAWARQFLKGDCAFLVERHGVTVLTPGDLGDQLEAEVRGDE